MWLWKWRSIGKRKQRVSQWTLENPSGFPHSHSLDGYLLTKKSVTYVSGHPLPMSPGQTLFQEGSLLRCNSFTPYQGGGLRRLQEFREKRELYSVRLATFPNLSRGTIGRTDR